MDTDSAAGSTVVIASVNDRKITTRSRMTNRTERPCTLLPVLPEAFCWSTWTAKSPVTCADNPGGKCAWVIFARMPSTRFVA